MSPPMPGDKFFGLIEAAPRDEFAAVDPDRLALALNAPGETDIVAFPKLAGLFGLSRGY